MMERTKGIRQHKQDINEILARFCGWKKGYVKRAGVMLGGGGWLRRVQKNDLGAAKGWIKEEACPVRCSVDCPDFFSGEHTTELLLALQQEGFAAEIRTNPPEAVVDGRKCSWGFEGVAWAPMEPEKALAYAAYWALVDSGWPRNKPRGESGDRGGNVEESPGSTGQEGR